ncbi:MucR family transcriptional regulator [Embleya sp. NPDC050154]|uniref:MucR family transcriptional regulator n=1 Tax=Embleya sp. NPDC050154 TaxID=3363988 RepID=UPI00378AF460
MADLGQQPEADGRLQCLECGRWYRLLPPHLGQAHDISAAEYRERHQLPARLGLRATDLRERATEQGRKRYAARPDIRAAMEAGRVVAPEVGAPEASRRTAGRVMNRAAKRAGGRAAREARLARLDARAVALGYADLAGYLEAVKDRPVAVVARELGCGRATVGRWRTSLIAPKP